MARHDGRETGGRSRACAPKPEVAPRHWWPGGSLAADALLGATFTGRADLSAREPVRALAAPWLSPWWCVARGGRFTADEGLLGLGLPLAPGGPRRLVPRALHALPRGLGIYLCGLGVLSQGPHGRGHAHDALCALANTVTAAWDDPAAPPHGAKAGMLAGIFARSPRSSWVVLPGR